MQEMIGMERMEEEEGYGGLMGVKIEVMMGREELEV